MQRKKQTETMASEDRLSGLSESILLYILSLLPERKEIVRSSVLSKTWRFLWKSVPLSLVFRSDSRIKEDICDFVSSIDRELQYWRLRNGDSFVTVDLDVHPAYGGGIEQTTSSFYELLQSVAHVENVELGYFSIQFLSGLELKGWQSPPSNWKSLKILTGLEQVSFSGICNILRVSLDPETLDIEFSNWGDFELVSDFTTEDEQSRWFQSYSLECSLLHLKTINIVQLHDQ